MAKQTTKCKITTGTREWADYNVNCIRGCYNDCRYCYAKIMAKRFGRKAHRSWKNMKIRQDVLSKNFKMMPGRVMFPSTHDIIDISPFREACFTVLGKLLESGNRVLITTKPKMSIVRDIDHHYYEHKEKIQFRFTITSYNNKLLEFWEPNAPKFEERLTSLKYTFKRRYRTSVSIEPFLDYNPMQLVKRVTPFTTESIWIGRMNYIAHKNITKEEEPYYSEIRKNYTTAHIYEIYLKLKDHPLIRFKDSIRIQLGIAAQSSH